MLPSPVGLFRKKEEKRSQNVRTEAEGDRLLAMPVTELAAKSLPAFGPDGPRQGQEGLAPFKLAST